MAVKLRSLFFGQFQRYGVNMGSLFGSSQQSIFEIKPRENKSKPSNNKNDKLDSLP